jgi:homogentisate 1,2-dioxygenase
MMFLWNHGGLKVFSATIQREGKITKSTLARNTLAFMIESSFIYKPTAYAMNGGLLQDDYIACWQNMPQLFKQKATS